MAVLANREAALSSAAADTQTNVRRGFILKVSFIVGLGGILYWFDMGVIAAALIFVRESFSLSPHMKAVVVKRGDHERVLITDTLPFETPIIFSGARGRRGRTQQGSRRASRDREDRTQHRNELSSARSLEAPCVSGVLPPLRFRSLPVPEAT